MSPTTTARPQLPLLKTPKSAGPILPSELPRSPHPGLGGLIKIEDDLRTPITPPTAYTDFLKALSPAVSTPMTSTSTRSSFSFSDKSGKLTPITQPNSACSCSCEPRKFTATSAPLIPPSPFVRPAPSRTPSGRTPTSLRRLRIPDSPYSSASASPRSAASKSATPKSATPKSSTLRSPYSPTSWYIDGKTRCIIEPPMSGRPRPVSVKQVVTRTVTYTRTALEPAPKGKRRRIE